MVGAEVLEHDQRLARMFPDRAVPLRQDAAAGGGPAKRTDAAQRSGSDGRKDLSAAPILFFFILSYPALKRKDLYDPFPLAVPAALPTRRGRALSAGSGTSGARSRRDDREIGRDRL